jgi:hypothetical protein
MEASADNICESVTHVTSIPSSDLIVVCSTLSVWSYRNIFLHLLSLEYGDLAE